MAANARVRSQTTIHWETDSNFKIVLVDGACEQILGRDAGSLIGRPLTGLEPEYRRFRSESSLHALRSLPDFSSDIPITNIEILAESGDVVNFNRLTEVLTDSEGGFQGIRCTDQKSVSHDLGGGLDLNLASPELFNLLFQSTADSVALIEIAGQTYVDVNPVFEEFTGWARDDAVGRSTNDLSTFVNPEEEEQFKTLLLTDGKVIKLSADLRRGDGTVFPGQISAGFFTQDDLLYVMTVMRTFEPSIEKERSEVERILMHGQRLEALGTLTGGIAHDFNNLLMAISGNVSILKMLPPDSMEFKSSLASIEQMIKDGNGLTVQLLGLAGGGSYTTEPCNLVELVVDELELFARTHRNLQLVNSMDCDAAVVKVNVGRFKQVLLNLLINAAEASSSHGRIEIRLNHVDVTPEEAAQYSAVTGPFACLSVSDNGHGMDRDTLEKVFEPFFTTKAMGKGTGLGLSSSLGIVRELQGFIVVDSKVDRGSTFSVHLPLCNEAPVTKETADPSEVQALSGDVLLVDDDEHVIKVVSQMIEILGFSVTSFVSAKEALRYFEDNSETIDVVMLDIVMAEMSGIELLKAIRTIKSDQRAVLSSGYSEEADAPYELRYGDTDFIQKPYDIEDLQNVLSKVAQ